MYEKIDEQRNIEEDYQTFDGYVSIFVGIFAEGFKGDYVMIAEVVLGAEGRQTMKQAIPSCLVFLAAHNIINHALQNEKAITKFYLQSVGHSNLFIMSPTKILKVTSFVFAIKLSMEIRNSFLDGFL